MTVDDVVAPAAKTLGNRLACGVAAVACAALTATFLLFYARTRSATGIPGSPLVGGRVAPDWPAARLLWSLAVMTAVVATIWTAASPARGRIGRASLNVGLCLAATAMVGVSLWLTPAKIYTPASPVDFDLAPAHRYLAAGMLAGGATLLLLLTIRLLRGPDQA